MQEAADPVDSISDEDYKLPRPLKKGDRVFVRDLKKEAVVEADPVSDQVQILIGVIKTRVPLKSLRLVENKKAGFATTAVIISIIALICGIGFGIAYVLVTLGG